MAKIPEKIKIGPFNYTVEDWKYKKAKKDGSWGMCDKIKLRLKIRTDLSPERKAEVLLHEVMHAIYDVTGLEHAGDLSEELVINSLSLTLTQVLRDNPELTAYLQNPYPDPVYKDHSVVTAETIGKRMLKEAFTDVTVGSFIKKADNE